MSITPRMDSEDCTGRCWGLARIEQAHAKERAERGEADVDLPKRATCGCSEHCRCVCEYCMCNQAYKSWLKYEQKYHQK